MYSSAVTAQRVAASVTTRPTLARMCSAAAVWATTSGQRCMSAKQVMPARCISAIASVVPSRTYSGSTQRRSSGHTVERSQRPSGRFSARPRSRTIAAWVCAFTRPGMRACAGRSTTSAAG